MPLKFRDAKWVATSSGSQRARGRRCQVFPIEISRTITQSVAASPSRKRALHARQHPAWSDARVLIAAPSAAMATAEKLGSISNQALQTLSASLLGIVVRTWAR